MLLDDFSLPLDGFQRELAGDVLRRAGAPFDSSDGARFRSEVARTWRLYQDERKRRQPRGPLAALHQIDRAIFARDREEYIDDPTLPPDRRRGLIRALDRLNRGLLAYSQIFAALQQSLRGVRSSEISVLDIGSGHGAFPIRLSRVKSLGPHRLRVVGSDLEPTYVEEARRAAAEARADVEFRVVNALELDRLDEKFDVITCTQTVHHFPPELLAEMMVRARQAARHRVLFFDARRTALNLFGVATAGALAGAGDLRFLHDGLVSIRRMYSPAELELLARCGDGGEVYRARNFRLSYVVLDASLS